MDDKARIFDNSKKRQSDYQEEDYNMELRKGPWTVEEDMKLFGAIATHGEGRWNSLAGFAGLNRSGKSCRLRWLNYLRPGVRRGNITLQEQLLILELHSLWGNRWSKIAQYLPGRTDNEIKNYWRTRVQKHAKQLRCDVNSKQFKDTMKYHWMPRLLERIQAAAPPATATTTASASGNGHIPVMDNTAAYGGNNDFTHAYTPESSSTAATSSSDSFGTQVSPASDFGDYCNNVPVKGDPNPNNNNFEAVNSGYMGNICKEPLINSTPSTNGFHNNGLGFQPLDQNDPWMDGGDASEDLWNLDDFWFSQLQLNDNGSRFFSE